MTQVFSVENKKGLQSNPDKKIRLDKKTSIDKKFPNLIGKYNKDRLSGKSKLYNDRNLDRKDWINLDYQDKLNNHCNTNFVR